MPFDNVLFCEVPVVSCKIIRLFQPESLDFLLILAELPRHQCVLSSVLFCLVLERDADDNNGQEDGDTPSSTNSIDLEQKAEQVLS